LKTEKRKKGARRNGQKKKIKRDEIERMKNRKRKNEKSPVLPRFADAIKPQNSPSLQASLRQARVPNAVPSPAGLSSLSKPLLTSNPQQTPPRQPLQNPLPLQPAQPRRRTSMAAPQSSVSPPPGCSFSRL
jgi:hypothetical protein